MQRVLLLRKLHTLPGCSGTIMQNLHGEPIQLSVGDYLLWKRHITQQIISDYANVTCDRNPIHTEQAKQPIAHGMLLGSMFSAMIGTTLPGVKYLKQTLTFPKSVPANTTVMAKVTVKRVFPSKRIVVLTTKVEDERKPYVKEKPLY
ncbi:enoyl-CoA hydratase [Blastocystis sp. ATCC 50177/Nand II]|uniref:Enoyl-CoA hydratase n=1 Tax=Blastocystis sp. subtype 1 (strain ATCC 50177 / NandII) TaxID=478820 RepID=A0A196SLV4_BLAHN|nr:enoyl-CoA hydratase [Blastocystis sp. ATCC 50177/Nand II]